MLTLLYDTQAQNAKIKFNAKADEPGLWTISDINGTRFGTDTIYGMATLAFSDTEWSSQNAQAMLGMAAADLRALIEIYIAHFNRAPDAMGLHFWAAEMNDGIGLNDISRAFYTSAEAVIKRPADFTNAQFVTEMYQNVFARLPDDVGLSFWTQVLDSGAIARPDFVIALLEGVSARPQDATADVAAQYQRDRDYLDDKTDIGVYFSMINGLNDVDQARAVMQSFDLNPATSLNPQELVDQYAQDAMDATTGDFVVKVLGVIDDPFASAIS